MADAPALRERRVQRAHPATRLGNVAVTDPVDARLLAALAEVGKVAVHELAATLGMDPRDVAYRLVNLSAHGLPLLVGVESDPAGLRGVLASGGHGAPTSVQAPATGGFPGHSAPSGPPVQGAPSGPYLVQGHPSGAHAVHGHPSGPHQVHGHPSGPHPVQGYPSGPHHVHGTPSGPHPVSTTAHSPSSAHSTPSGAHPVQDVPSGSHPVQGTPSGPHQVHGTPSGAYRAPHPNAPGGAYPAQPGPVPYPPPHAAPPSVYPAAHDPAMTMWGPPQSALWARGDQLTGWGTAAPLTEQAAEVPHHQGRPGDTLHTQGMEGERLAVQLLEVQDPADFLFSAAGYRLEEGERAIVVHTEVTNTGTIPFASLPDNYLDLIGSDGSVIAKAPVSLTSRPPHRIGVGAGETSGGHTVYVVGDSVRITAVRWSPRPEPDQHSLTWTLDD